MPDWAYDSSATSSASDYIWSFSGTAQQVYDEWKQECKRQDQAYELQMQIHEQQNIEDRKRYPLFFLKEGIV